MKEKRPSFVEVFVDMDVVHSNMAQPRGLANRAATLRWDDLPDKGKKLIATQLVTPVTMTMLPKDWVEGINALQKK